MYDEQNLSEAFELGKVAGGISQAQVAECPYQHITGAERQAWLEGFSAGRKSLHTSNGMTADGKSSIYVERPRRAMPFGSRVVYHFSTRTIAVDFLEEIKVLGPFTDEDAAYQAAFAFVERRRAVLDVR